MREILFRGQTRRKGQKVWMDGKPVDSNWVEGYGVCMGKGDFSVIYAGSPVEKFPVYTDTVGQYIGLTDKNGKKIFEGDILRWVGLDGESGIVYVKFARGVFAFQGIECPSADPDLFSDFEYGGQTLEIIGNIHDNPELLGGADNENHS